MVAAQYSPRLILAEKVLARLQRQGGRCGPSRRSQRRPGPRRL